MNLQITFRNKRTEYQSKQVEDLKAKINQFERRESISKINSKFSSKILGYPVRILTNNEGLTYEVAYRVAGNFDSITQESDVSLEDKTRIIEYFAKRGDPLACKIVDQCKVGLLAFNLIAEEILMRRMTKYVYEGYLNGKIPLAVFRDETYFGKGGQPIYLD